VQFKIKSYKQHFCSTIFRYDFCEKNQAMKITVFFETQFDESKVTTSKRQLIHLAILTLSWNNQTKCHSQKISNPTKDYKLCNCSWLRKKENRNYQFSAWNEHTAMFWEVHISTPVPSMISALTNGMSSKNPSIKSWLTSKATTLLKQKQL